MEDLKVESQPRMNVLGKPLTSCSCSPMTGWIRDGYCRASHSDLGDHIICCVMTKSFLSYSKAQGNNLSTPIPEFNFPGLEPGNHWCLCASRWKEAYLDGMAPLVCLESTDIKALEIIGLEAVSYTHLTLPTTPYV